MNLQLKIESDIAGQRVFIHVQDISTSPATEHPEYGSISLSLLDIAKADLFSTGAGGPQVKLGNFSPLGPPFYLLASGNQVMGSDGTLHTVALREVKTCVDGKQRSIIGLLTDAFKGTGDPT